MLEHYSHIRTAAKRMALDGIAQQAPSTDFQAGVNQEVHQPANGNSEASSNSLN